MCNLWIPIEHINQFNHNSPQSRHHESTKFYELCGNVVSQASSCQTLELMNLFENMLRRTPRALVFEHLLWRLNEDPYSDICHEGLYQSNKGSSIIAPVLLFYTTEIFPVFEKTLCSNITEWIKKIFLNSMDYVKVAEKKGKICSKNFSEIYSSKYSRSIFRSFLAVQAKLYLSINGRCSKGACSISTSLLQLFSGWRKTTNYLNGCSATHCHICTLFIEALLLHLHCTEL